jgi:hypothetical protein
MLDEKSLRRPGFSEGYKVKLADGQEWTFPKPRIQFRPQLGPDGRVEVGGGPSFGPEYDHEFDVLFGVVEVDALERLRVKFEMLVRLLTANYRLSADEVAELLVLEPGNDASDQLWDELSNVLMGIAPKP